MCFFHLCKIGTFSARFFQIIAETPKTFSLFCRCAISDFCFQLSRSGMLRFLNFVRSLTGQAYFLEAFGNKCVFLWQLLPCQVLLFAKKEDCFLAFKFVLNLAFSKFAKLDTGNIWRKFILRVYGRYFSNCATKDIIRTFVRKKRF